MGLPDIETKVDALIVKVDALLAKESIMVDCIYCSDGLIPQSVNHGQSGIGPDIEWITCPYCNGNKKVVFGELNE